MKEKINRRPAANKHGGFSLIELLIVSIISIIVLWGAIDFFNSQQKVFRQQSLQARNQANVRMGLYYISKDLINAGFTGGPFGIETAVRDAQQRGITNFRCSRPIPSILRQTLISRPCAWATRRREEIFMRAPLRAAPWTRL